MPLDSPKSKAEWPTVPNWAGMPRFYFPNPESRLQSEHEYPDFEEEQLSQAN